VIRLLAISLAALSFAGLPASAAVASKKGLQVELVDDALALGVKHAALNFNLAALVDPSGDTNNPSYEFQGRAYHFRKGYLERMDSQIKTLSDHGMLVYLIVLVYQSGDAAVNRVMLHPDYDERAPNRLGAFNTSTEEGRAWFGASMEFVAQRWSRVDRKFGAVAGYIIGNEVNSHWFWSNMGATTMERFADDYLRTVRLAHDSVRKHSPNAPVYISLEHHWNIRYPGGNERQAFAGRPFVDHFARQARAAGDFGWHMAFHPYPENLFEPRFWNDKTATTNADTPRITFKNLEVLTTYMQRDELLHNGQPRRIILSEQGFHTPNTPEGETIQAAAYCYAYKKVEAMDGIDAFILHRHVDNDHEGGLMLGLRRNKPVNGEAMPPKKIYECFRLADTPDWEPAFEFALPIVGLKAWPGR
jgi:hypothetical protein